MLCSLGEPTGTDLRGWDSVTHESKQLVDCEQYFEIESTRGWEGKGNALKPLFTADAHGVMGAGFLIDMQESLIWVR